MEAQRLRLDQISLTHQQGMAHRSDAVGGRRGGALGNPLLEGPMHCQGPFNRPRQPDICRSAVRGKAGIRGDTPLAKCLAGSDDRDYPIKPAPPPIKVKPPALQHVSERYRGRQTRGGAILGAVRGEPSSATSTSSTPFSWMPPPPPPAHCPPVPTLQSAHRQYSAPVDGVWGLGCSDRHHVRFDRTPTNAQAPPVPQILASSVTAHTPGTAPKAPPRKQFLITSHPGASSIRVASHSSHSTPLPGRPAAQTKYRDATSLTPKSQKEPRPLQDLFVSDREWPFAAHDSAGSPPPDSECASESPNKPKDARTASLATSSADGTSNKVPPPPSSPVSINVVMNTPPSASKPFVVLVKQPQPPPHPPGLPVHTVNNSIALGAHLPIAAVPPAPPPPPPQRWHTSTGSHGLWAAKSSAGTENFCLNSGRVIGGARGIGARGTQGPKTYPEVQQPPRSSQPSGFLSVF